MNNQRVNIPDLKSELIFKTSRSSGPGGQNVNKVNTRVELRFNISESKLLNKEQKHILLVKLKSKISQDGFLIVVSQKERSQILNKEEATKKLYSILSKALTPVKKRKPTRPTKVSVEKRIQTKKQQGEKKTRRGKIDF